MFTMVLEFADRSTLATTPDEREYLMVNTKPPDSWQAWIGRAVQGHIWGGAWNHFAWGHPLDGAPESDPSDWNQSQTTAAIIDCFYFQTFSTRDESQKVDAGVFAQTHGLGVLWPVNAAIAPLLTRPTTTLGAFAADGASRDLYPDKENARYAWQT